MQRADFTIVGNIATAPEFTDGDNPHVRFRIAATPTYRDENGDWRDKDSTYLSITAWGRLARNIVADITTGDPITVTGSIRTREWTTEDGEKRSRTEFVASTVAIDLTRTRAIIQEPQRA